MGISYELRAMSFLRVCIVSPLFHPNLGGVGRQAMELTNRLRKSGVELFVLSRKMKNLPEFEVPPDIDLRYIPAFRPAVHNLEEKSFQNFIISLSFSLMLAFKLFRMRKKYDIVHFQGASIPLIICLPLLKLLRKKVIAKVLASGLGTEAGSLRGRYVFLGDMMACILRKTDSFIAISQEIAEGLRNDGVSQGKIEEITNFVDTAEFYPVSNEEKQRIKSSMSMDKHIVVNFTGRIVERKGIDILVNAFSNIGKLFQGVTLIIVGFGPEEDKIKNLVLKLGLGNKVKLLGHSGKTAGYYQASDIFVLPSYAEGMPNSLLEAMSCGLPCIASRIGGVVDVVEDGKTGILFNPGDTNGLASAMAGLLKDAGLRERLGSEARKRIIENFSIDRIADEYIKLYNKLIADS